MLRITPATVTKGPFTGESPKETVKTTRVRECRAIRRTCGDLLACFFHLHARLRVRLSARHSPRPSGRTRTKTRAHRVARMSACGQNHFVVPANAGTHNHRCQWTRECI